MNISLPFSHPGCMEKKGNESKRVRGRYVSVERVQEMDKGRQVEWRMATSSDAGGKHLIVHITPSRFYNPMKAIFLAL